MLQKPGCSETCTIGCQFDDTEWHVLTTSERSQFDSALRSRQYSTGSSIFQQFDDPQGIYCVKSGVLLLTRYDASGVVIGLRLVGAGETVGWRSYFGEEPHAATALALTDCDVCFLPSPVFAELIDSNKQLMRQFLKTLARDPGPMDATLLRSPHFSAKIRLTHLLLILVDFFKTENSNDHAVIHLPLKRTHIAWLIDVRAETLSRTIRELSDQELASFDGTRVIIPSLTALRELVEQSPASGSRLKV